jgi:hypothetical protein
MVHVIFNKWKVDNCPILVRDAIIKENPVKSGFLQITITFDALMLVKMIWGQAEQHCPLVVFCCTADYRSGQNFCELKSNGQTTC